jgi:hypothetical protein
MFVCLFTLLSLPVACVAASWYVNDTAPDVIKIVARRSAQKIMPIALRILVWILRYLHSLRSNYIWGSRIKYPRVLQRIADRAMMVDPSSATLGVSSAHRSIRVDQAIATYEGTDYDVRDMFEMMWACGDGESITFNLSRVLGYEDVVFKQGASITIRVRYSGHSHREKRTPPQTYSVRYSGLVSDTGHFPPYPASEPVKKGLGVVKIVGAERSDRSSCLKEARESGGLHGKFYRDTTVPDSLARDVVTFMDESDRIHEDLSIKVVTSKGVLEFN